MWRRHFSCWVETFQKPRRLSLKSKPLADARLGNGNPPDTERDREGVVPVMILVSGGRNQERRQECRRCRLKPAQSAIPAAVRYSFRRQLCARRICGPRLPNCVVGHIAAGERKLRHIGVADGQLLSGLVMMRRWMPRGPLSAHDRRCSLQVFRPCLEYGDIAAVIEGLFDTRGHLRGSGDSVPAMVGRGAMASICTSPDSASPRRAGAPLSPSR